MFVPQEIKPTRTERIGNFPTGITDLDVVECYSVLDALASREAEPLMIVESETGDLRDYDIVYRSPSVSRLFDYGQLWLPETFLDDFFDDSARLKRLFDAFDEGRVASEEFVTHSINEMIHQLQIDIAQLRATSTGLPRWVLVIRDLSEEATNERVHEMLAGARCMVWHALVDDVTGNGELLWATRCLNEESALRWLPIELMPERNFAQSWPNCWLPEEAPRLHSESYNAIMSGSTGYTHEFRCRTADGNIRWIQEDVQIEQPRKNHWRLIGVCTDITARKVMEAERERLLSEAIERADKDALTGLLNHRAFHSKFAELMEAAVAENSMLALVILDLDNFKFFNDVYGHPVGDSVLLQAAASFGRCCGPDDVLTRFGGDEFAVLTRVHSEEEASAFEKALLSSLLGTGYTPTGYDTAIPLTASTGIAILPVDGNSRGELLAAADERLLRAKFGASGTDMLMEELKARLSNDFDQFAMLNALVSAVDNKDRYTRRHSEDVMRYSLEIAEEVGMSEEDQFHLQIAALLHDVGKIGVPDAVLRKPGKLTDDEFNAIKQHPVMGAIMVAAVPGFEYTLDAVRHHHERVDGRGYPDRLVGDAIPFTARLMAVADAFSAMTTDRPYRKGMPTQKALAILAEGAGTQWDTALVEAFTRARTRAIEERKAALEPV